MSNLNLSRIEIDADSFHLYISDAFDTKHVVPRLVLKFYNIFKQFKI